jgi:hypothetical protein
MSEFNIYQAWVEFKTKTSKVRKVYYLKNVGELARFVTAAQAMNVQVLRVSSEQVYDWSDAIDALEDDQTQEEAA